VIRRIHIIGILALGLIAGAVSTAPAYGRLVCSAQNIQKHFRDLRQSGDSLNPIERLVFSLVMANTKQAPAATTHSHRS
jgi:hypothetical protein